MTQHSRFIYVTFIRATPQKVWDAIIQPEQTRRYWHGVTQVSDWTPGADWKMTFADGRVTDAGRVVEIDPPRRLVLEWRNEFMPELKAEGFSRCCSRSPKSLESRASPSPTKSMSRGPS